MLKVQRAQQHLAEMHGRIEAYLQTDFCRIMIRADDDADRLVVQAPNPLPVEVSMALGDCVHNLRTALDYAMSKIVNDAGIRSTRIGFPTHETRANLIESFRNADPHAIQCPSCGRSRGGAGANNPIKQAAPELVDIIVDGLKPYGEGDGVVPDGRAIWGLGKLDNIAKHRNIVPVVTVHSVAGFSAELPGGGGMYDCTVEVSPGPGESAGGLVAVNRPGLKITDYGQPVVKISFEQGIPFAGEPVIPTLHQLCDLTRRTISTLETHFR